MTVTRTVSVKSQHVRKAVPGVGPGDKILSVEGDWVEVVDFKVSVHNIITFQMSGGFTRRIKFGNLIAVQRETKD